MYYLLRSQYTTNTGNSEFMLYNLSNYTIQCVLGPEKILSTTASSELILELECMEEELLAEQEDFYKKEEKEYKDVLAKFEKLVKENSGEIVHKGDSITASQYFAYGKYVKIYLYL